MNDATLWWIGSAMLVALQLGRGSFYLLMLAGGAAAGAVAAHLGLTQPWQWVSASVLGLGASGVLWKVRNGRQRASPPPNADISLDVGASVRVDAWDPHGHARVRWRGTDWSARHAGGTVPVPGAYRIKALEGSTLVLEPEADDQSGR